MTSRRILPRLLLAWAMWVGLESAAWPSSTTPDPRIATGAPVVIFVVLMAGPLYFCAPSPAAATGRARNANPLTPKGLLH